MPKKKYLMGIDIGVSLVKVGVYDCDGNNLITVSGDNPGEYAAKGTFIQKSENILDIVIDVIKEVLEKSEVYIKGKIDIEGIGFSGAMGGIMGVDKDYNPVADWSLANDSRYIPYVNQVLASHKDEILRLSGTNFPIFAPKILWWKNDFPEIYKKVSKFIGIYGFLAAKMSDIPIESAFIDNTITMFSGIADLEKSEWSEQLVKELKIDQEKLPTIINSCTVIGKVSKKFSQLTGLDEGIAIAAGAGDKAAGNLGVGLTETGLLVDEAATYGALSICVDKYIPDFKNRTLENLPSPIKGLYTPGAYLFLSGATSTWFIEMFGQNYFQKEMAKASIFEIFDSKADKIPPGSEGLMSIGLLGGRGYPSDPDIRGLWIGFSHIHTPDHFYRSMLESFAYEYSCYLDAMRDNYKDTEIKEVFVIGGGSHSRLFNKIKSDALGLKYSSLKRNDFTLLGNILIAGNSVGIFKDLKTSSKRFIEKSEEFYPNPENTLVYSKYKKIYKSLFDKNRSIYADLKNI